MATSMRPASCSWGTRSIRRASRTGSATSTSDGSASRCCGSRAPRTRSPGGTSSRGCWAASESGPRSIASRAATTRSGFEVRNGTTGAPARPSARPRPGSSWGGREEHLCTLADARFGRSAPLSPEVLEPDERPDRLEPLSTSCGYDEVLPQTQGPLAGPARLPALLHLRREAGGPPPRPRPANRIAATTEATTAQVTAATSHPKSDRGRRGDLTGPTAPAAGIGALTSDVSPRLSPSSPLTGPPPERRRSSDRLLTGLQVLTAEAVQVLDAGHVRNQFRENRERGPLEVLGQPVVHLDPEIDPRNAAADPIGQPVHLLFQT